MTNLYLDMVILAVIVLSAITMPRLRDKRRDQRPAKIEAKQARGKMPSGYISANLGRYTAMWGSPLFPLDACGHSHGNRDAAMKCLEHKRRTGRWA